VYACAMRQVCIATVLTQACKDLCLEFGNSTKRGSRHVVEGQKDDDDGDDKVSEHECPERTKRGGLLYMCV
jgi:hypothetical protein